MRKSNQMFNEFRIMLCYLSVVVSSQESTEGENVNIWIQGCIINIKWNAVTDLESCFLEIYRVQLYKNQTDLPPVDTSALRYSLEGIDSKSIYRVKITPIFMCTNDRQQGKTMEKSISTFPGKSFVRIFHHMSAKSIPQKILWKKFQ